MMEASGRNQGGGGRGPAGGARRRSPLPARCLLFSALCLLASAVCLTPPGRRARADSEGALLEVGGGPGLAETVPAPEELKVVSYNIRYRAGDDLKRLIQLLREDPEIGGARPSRPSP